MNYLVNQYIELRLENGKTVIYINGEEFIICKTLIIDLNSSEYKNSISSVDKFIELYEDAHSSKLKYGVTSEQEFWAHCSSLQVWIESDYDTSLIDSRLSFPILQKLTKLGDTIAIRVFKAELVKRMKCASYKIQRFLLSEGYLDSLNEEELLIGILNEKEYENFIKIKSSSREYIYKITPDFDEDEVRNKQDLDLLFYSAYDGYITSLELVLNNYNYKDMLNILPNFHKLKLLKIWSKNLKEMDFPFDIPSIEYLKIVSDENTLVRDCFQKFANLKHLEIHNCCLESYYSLENLDYLSYVKFNKINFTNFSLDVIRKIREKIYLWINGIHL